MSSLIDIEQDTTEWHEFRSQGIGASEAPTIMGVGYLTPHMLWEQRLGLKPKQEANSSMQRGKDLEPIARDMFTSQTGIKMKPALRIHSELSWMRCSLDGISDDGRILEIKCPNRKRHQMAMDGIIPPEYYPQLQHQIEVCNTDSAFYASFDGQSLKVLEIGRNDEYIKSLKANEEIFWECLQNLENPELIDRDFELIDTPEWKQYSEQYLEADRLNKKSEKLKEEAKRNLILLGGFKNVRGNGIKLSKTKRKGNVDYSAIPEIREINLELYRKPAIEVWRIS